MGDIGGRVMVGPDDLEVFSSLNDSTIFAGSLNLAVFYDSVIPYAAMFSRKSRGKEGGRKGRASEVMAFVFPRKR